MSCIHTQTQTASLAVRLKYTHDFFVLLSPSLADTELQLRRDSIFCQSLVAAICTFSEQLLAALNYRYNNNGEYEESSRDASRKWLEQIAATGVLLNYQSLLSPAVVRWRILAPLGLLTLTRVLLCHLAQPEPLILAARLDSHCSNLWRILLLITMCQYSISHHFHIPSFPSPHKYWAHCHTRTL